MTEHRVRIGIPTDSLPVTLIIELVPEPPAPPGPLWAAPSVANIRADPNTITGAIVGKLQPGDQVRELERLDGWIRHAQGWTAKSVLRLVG